MASARGYGDLKAAVGDAVVAELAPLQERYRELRADEERARGRARRRRRQGARDRRADARRRARGDGGRAAAAAHTRVGPCHARPRASAPCCATSPTPRRPSGSRPTRPARSPSSAAARRRSPSPATTTRSCSRRPRARQHAALRGRARRRRRAGRCPTTRIRRAVIRTHTHDEQLRLAFGSCRVSVPHTEPYVLSKDDDPAGREVDALLAFVERMRHEPCEQWPDALLLLGDQVYADEVSPRDQGADRRAARPATARQPTRWATSRSTPRCTARAGATRRCAGCCRRSPAR